MLRCWNVTRSLTQGLRAGAPGPQGCPGPDGSASSMALALAVGLGCAGPLQLIQGIINPGAGSGSVFLWTVSG